MFILLAAYFIVTGQVPHPSADESHTGGHGSNVPKQKLHPELEWLSPVPLREECEAMCSMCLAIVPANRPKMDVIVEDILHWNTSELDSNLDSMEQTDSSKENSIHSGKKERSRSRSQRVPGTLTSLPEASIAAGCSHVMHYPCLI